jgi:hypothetical protein
VFAVPVLFSLDGFASASETGFDNLELMLGYVVGAWDLTLYVRNVADKS